jgi:gas vesicle protein
MGDPKYIKKLELLYGVEFGNVSEDAQTEILLMIKRSLTKKEYKVYFQFMDDSSDEVMTKINATKEDMDLHHKKAQRKLKDSKLQNAIIALAHGDNG